MLGLAGRDYFGKNCKINEYIEGIFDVDMLPGLSLEKRQKKRPRTLSTGSYVCQFYRTFIHVYFLSGLLYQLAYHYRGISTVC